MRRFKYKLEVVLKERKRLEDARLKEWTLAKRFLQALLEDLAELERQLEDAIAKGDLTATVEKGSVGLLSAIDSFVSGQKLRITWKGQEIERAAKFTERRRVDYVAARQKREALEKLKARRFAEYRQTRKQHETKELDDLYIMNGAARRRMEEEGDEA